MRQLIEWISAKVVACEDIAHDVRRVTFDVGRDLAPVSPGSHLNIKVTIAGKQVVRTYTLVPTASGDWSIAVKLHANSRGGSQYIWSLEPGAIVEITTPENRFELSWRAPHCLLIAGGIGVTPIYAMAKALAPRGASLRMVYGAQNRASMAFVDELEGLLGDRLSLKFADGGEAIELQAEIAGLPEGAELYVCGPLGLLSAVKSAWAESGRAVSGLRYEVFGDNGKFVERGFEVEVAHAHVEVSVPPDMSLLDALLGAGVDMVYDCRRGECGLCAVDILELDGEIDHRDVFLSDEEKRENRRMCACVSRLARGRATIDTGLRP